MRFLPALGRAAVWTLLALGATQLSAAERRLNVVLILADDLGWTDLGCFGSDLYRTPNIDQLAKDGMKFTQAYSACTVCSPTRASLLSGQNQARLHVTDWIPGRLPANPRVQIPDWTKHLPAGTTTIASVLKSAGYTTASVGKWHLGGEEFYPEKFGFDVNVAGTYRGSPTDGYFSPYKLENLPDGPAGEYLTDRITDEAVKFLRQNQSRPFFLYLPEFAVHTPLQAKKEVIARYQDQARKPGQRHTNATYAAMVESMDDSVGRIRAELGALGLAQNTIIIFASDNGGHLPTTDNSPLRAGKGSSYEGGVRVPFIVYWPGVTKAGQASDTPTISTDIFPTIVAATGVAMPRGTFDGLSLEPVLRGKGALPERTFYWHYPHYQLYQKGGTTPYSAVRVGDYKLIEFYADHRIELYDLAHDMSEKHDLVATQPERARKLQAQLHEWLKEAGAQVPVLNPKFDPQKPENPPGARPMEAYN